MIRRSQSSRHRDGHLRPVFWAQHRVQLEPGRCPHLEHAARHYPTRRSPAPAPSPGPPSPVRGTPGRSRRPALTAGAGPGTDLAGFLPSYRSSLLTPLAGLPGQSPTCRQNAGHTGIIVDLPPQALFKSHIFAAHLACEYRLQGRASRAGASDAEQAVVVARIDRPNQNGLRSNQPEPK